MSFPALHSVLAPIALAGMVAETYGLPQPALTLLRRGLNDTSRVQSGEQRTILRVYRCGWRTPAEVGWELAFLQHLIRIPIESGRFRFNPTCKAAQQSGCE
ncbi:hypothetical protein ACTQ9L_12010 [Deinococcus wulumuqiensis]